jgi:hypothetical protein
MSEQRQNASKRYVLVTAAYNEEAFIEKTIAAVVAQTVPPEQWVIVSDCSTDRTDEIVRDYSGTHNFIQLLRITEEHPRNFAAQVNAINRGVKRLDHLGYDFVGNLDADISFSTSYYGQLLAKFEQNPRLGLGGGTILEEQRGQFRSRRSNRSRSVAHAVQFFRRECFESIGGYLPLKYGGPDWHAEVSARMKDWDVRSFPDLGVFHHRPTGTADRLMRHWFRQGRMDYSLGSLLLFEAFKCLLRVPEKPFFLGAVSRLAGFTWSNLRRDEILVSDEFVRFLREEQKERLWPIPRGLRRHKETIPPHALGQYSKRM